MLQRVVVGPGFVAVGKFGPFRLALAESITSGGLHESQRGGVLELHTGDGRTMRLRRVEFSHPEVNRKRLDLLWREDFGHHRYLLDAVD